MITATPTKSSDTDSGSYRALRGAGTQRIATRLAEWIKTGRIEPGNVLPSERQLSSELGISRGSVRKVFTALEDDGLLDAAGRGQLRRVRLVSATSSLSIMSKTVVVVGFNRMPDGRIPFEPGWNTYTQFTATARLQSLGWNCLTINLDEAMSAQIEQMRHDPPAGVIVCNTPVTPASLKHLGRLKEMGLRIAAYGEADKVLQWDRVFHDHAAGAEALTRWLIAQGRRRILPFWRFPSRFSWIEQREAGYRRAMAEAGFEAIKPIHTPDLHLVADKQPFDDMVRLQMGFLQEALHGPNPVDALMCANDLHAAEAFEAVRRLGKVPGCDVLITGYDNTWLRDRRDPDRTIAPSASIDKGHAAIGVMLTELLLQRTRDELPDTPQQRSAEFELILPDGSSSASIST